MPSDLQLTHQRQPPLDNVNRATRDAVDLAVNPRSLFNTVSDRANLVQAILNRLHTHQGTLAELGHPDYGSRLHELVGELNNDRTRRLAELYIRQCLAQEGRIAQVLEVVFVTSQLDREGRSTLVAQVSLRPVDDLAALVLDLTLTL
ncbi:GPW/gp25 family protein [Nodosilinea sp. FACHB-13]|uniref:GPW/gp25 family protein n=1 Tax=Cyanophyceae TaxID=3028117 RepID=UPI001682E8FD|nr:GPW/gp25 family protein [Nodosilinea sp. FACHB-13]MBD2110046.1 GPW/gp25 family protein [Nodosilinea sp. FACHB-13]